MTTYCDMQFTWICDKSTDLITEYSVIDEETDPSLNGQSGPRVNGQSDLSLNGQSGLSLNGQSGLSLNGQSGPSLNGQSGPSLNGQTGLSLNGQSGLSLNGQSGPSLNGQSGPSLNGETGPSLNNVLEFSQINDEDCQFEISCKSLYKVAVVQFVIVTEARVVELYDYTEGYLLSQRGVTVPGHSPDQNLYQINCMLTTPIRKFYGKLKSLPDKNKVKVYKIEIKVTTCEDLLLNVNSGDSINVPKLKQLVAELTDVPDNAKSLLEAMEQYQKNKISTVDDIKRQLCQESTGQDTSMSGMSKMVAMFSQLNSSASSNQSPLASQNALFSMISSVQNGQQANNEGMYNFLKTICGQVTDMRAPASTLKVPDDLNSKDEIRSDENQPSGAASSMEDTKVDEKLQELEKKVLTKVDKKIDALEQRLSSKLDLILQGLNIQSKPDMDLD